MNVNGAPDGKNTREEEQVTRMWADVERADRACDAAEIARLLPLLLARDDRIESLAHIEQYFRAENYNARLVAAALVPSLSMQQQKRFKSLDPRRALPASQALASSSSLAYYVSVNVEGAESSAREQRAHGTTSEQMNRERLRHQCGFLVLDDDVTSLFREKTTHSGDTMVIQFGSNLQVQTFQSLSSTQGAARICCSCRRLGNAAIELRSLDCCRQEWCCSTACYELHVDAVHGDALQQREGVRQDATLYSGGEPIHRQEEYKDDDEDESDDDDGEQEVSSENDE